MKQYKILGINDDATYCTLCNKQELKRVVWLKNNETGEIFPYGTTCAAKLLRITVKEFKTQLNDREKYLQKLTRRIYRRSKQVKAERKAVEYCNENRDIFPDIKTRMEYLFPYITETRLLKEKIKEKYKVKYVY